MGMLFNRRRQTSDRNVVSRICERSAGGRLWANHYTAKLFAQSVCPQMVVDEAFLEKAGAGEYCFAENGTIALYEGRAEKIVLYRWNRIYPSDVRFPIVLDDHGWKLAKRNEFAGYSHDRITEEIYER